MGYDHQTTVQISENQRETWEEYIEENDLRGKGELVRFAVQDYIENDGWSDGDDKAQQEAISTLQETVNRLDQAMEDVQSDLRAIKRQTSAVGDEVKEIAHDLLDLLPREEEVDPRAWEQYPKPLEEYDPDRVDDVAISASALHAWLDKDAYDWPVSQGDVEDALYYLRDQHVARKTGSDGEDRWVKEV